MSASSPSKKQVGDQKIVCSDQEGRFFYSILKNVNGKPNINWDAVAEESGYKSGATAKVRFGQIKKKLGLTDTNPASSVVTTPTNPAKITKARATKPSPASKDIKGKGKGKAVAGEGSDEEVTSEIIVNVGNINKDSGENDTALVPKQEFAVSGVFNPGEGFMMDHFNEAIYYKEMDDEEKEMVKLENEFIDYTGSQF